MKIAFIDTKGLGKGVNLGLGYLCAVIEKHRKFDKLIVFDFNNSPEEPAKKLEKIKGFDIVGISIKSFQLDETVEVAKKIREHNRILVAGGIHPTIDRNFLEQNPVFDIAVMGEAEETILDIVDYANGKKALKDIKGIAYRENGEVKINAPRELLKNLDSLPYPNYDYFDSVTKPEDIDPYPLSTSRGCPYSCIYCCANKISGKGFRPRTPESVIDELIKMKEKYKPSQINIIDDNFTLDIDRAKKIIKLMIEKNINIHFVPASGIRADRVDRELLELFIKTGCTRLCFGIESGNKKVFENINKGETLEDITKAIKLCQSMGISISGFFIIGLPYATKGTEEESIKFAQSLNLDRASWSFLVPYPGTEVWDWATQNNYVLGDWKNMSSGMFHQGKETIVSTPEFTREDRIKIFKEANIKTFNYPALFDRKKGIVYNMFMTVFLILRYDAIHLHKHIGFAYRHLKGILYYSKRLY